MKIDKIAGPYIITQELLLDDHFWQRIPEPVTKRQRVILWLRALLCQVRAFSFTSEEYKIKGWIAHDGTIYVTQARRL